VRWSQDHAVREVLGLASFDEDDLYAALDDLCARQETFGYWDSPEGDRIGR
jgi:hypothetical protein